MVTVSPTPEPATLRRVIELAGRAPSVENSQPWRWRRTAAGLELHVDGRRRLPGRDPSGRNAVISCGAALHHVQVAAAALGWGTEVDRVPDRSGASLLARIELHPAPPPGHAEADLRAIAERCTDRRRFTSWPVPAEPLHRLAHIASAHGTEAAPLLGVTERFRAELLVSRAGESEGTEVSDGLIVLSGASDDAAAWLSAGEGLSALWLAATDEGLSVVPLSEVVDVPETRRALQHEVLAGRSHPLLLVRIGWQEISRSQLPRTERRPVEDVLDCGETCEPCEPASRRHAAPAG